MGLKTLDFFFRFEFRVEFRVETAEPEADNVSFTYDSPKNKFNIHFIGGGK